MPLENMSLAEAIDFTSYLSTCVEVAKDLDAIGYVPILDMTPGEPICITVLGHEVPDFGMHADLFADPGHDEMLGGEREGLQRHSLAEKAPVQAVEETGQTGAPAVETGCSTAEAPDAEPSADELASDMLDALGQVLAGENELSSPLPPEPVADDAPPAVVAAAAGDDEQDPAGDVLPDPAEVAGEQAPATEDGGGCPAAASPAVTPTPRFDCWTPEQDARLIELVVAEMQGGKAKTPSIAAAAQIIGRSKSAATMRLHKPLRVRFEEALRDDLRQPALATDQPEPPKAAPSPEAKPVQLVPAVPKAPDPELELHLDRLPRKDWSILDDIRVLTGMHAGEGLYDIARAIGRLKGSEVSQRTDLLLGKARGPGGWRNAYSTEEVLAALQARAGKAVP